MIKAHALVWAFILITFGAVKVKSTQFIPAVIWFIIANILFLMPGDDVPSVGFLDAIYFDKWVHAGLFFGLTILTVYPFILGGHFTKKLLIKVAIIYIFYGVLIELLQKYVAIDRDYDLKDVIADSTGCLLAYFAGIWLNRKIQEKNKPL